MTDESQKQSINLRSKSVEAIVVAINEIVFYTAIMPSPSSKAMQTCHSLEQWLVRKRIEPIILLCNVSQDLDEP